MIEFLTSGPAIYWIAAIVVFLVVEALTAGLTCIWFAVGALASLIAALFGAPIWLQIVWFFVISIVALIATRPLVKKYVNTKSQPTNADMVIGMEALVTETIDNIAGAGAVNVGGKVWTARADGMDTIAEGELVTVLRIEGVKLMVCPAAEAPDQAGPADE